MIIKYTNNGKKVQIFEKLNQDEYIVQEIICYENGTEMPSGENFIVKHLHDKPVKSWRQEEIERWEAEHKKKKDILSTENKRLDHIIQQVRHKIKAIIDVEKYFHIDQLKHLDLFIAGGITHFIELGYRIKISEFTRAMATSSYDCDKFKLLSLFGRSGGNLEWRLHQYSDTSGGSQRIEPCISYEDALEKAQAHIDKYIVDNNEISNGLQESAAKYGLSVPEEILKKQHDNKIRKAYQKLERAKAKWMQISKEIATLEDK